MHTVTRALVRAGRDMFTPAMLALAVWPMLVALLLWGGLAWGFGDAWVAAMAGWLAGTPVLDVFEWLGVGSWLAYLAVFLVVLLWLPAVYVTVLMIAAFVLMPAIVRHVAERHYPRLERRQGGSLAGGVANGVFSTLAYLVAWLLLLPLWLLTPLGLLVSVLLNGWLNLRLFLYDALAEHASAEELARLRRGDGPTYLLSGVLGLLLFIPLVNLLAPVYMGLAFAHHALARLDAARKGESA